MQVYPPSLTRSIFKITECYPSNFVLKIPKPEDHISILILVSANSVNFDGCPVIYCHEMPSRDSNVTVLFPPLFLFLSFLLSHTHSWRNSRFIVPITLVSFRIAGRKQNCSGIQGSAVHAHSHQTRYSGTHLLKRKTHSMVVHKYHPF